MNWDPQRGPTWSDVDPADTCPGSTVDNPHLYDERPGSCETCERRRTL